MWLNLKYSEQRKLEGPFLQEKFHFRRCTEAFYVHAKKGNLELQKAWAHSDDCTALHWRLVAALAGVEHQLVLVQDELHYLVLEDHVHGDVAQLHLWPEESRTEYNSHILHSHAIFLPVFNEPVREKINRIM